LVKLHYTEKIKSRFNALVYSQTSRLTSIVTMDSSH